MTVQGNLWVFAILAVAFAVVLVWLLIWSRRQSRAIRRYAESNGLMYRAEDIDQVEETVNECVRLEEENLTRRFSRVSDVVALQHGILFRGVELLGLNPYGRAEYVNKSRVAVTFPLESEAAGIFSVFPGLNVHQRHPEEPLYVDHVRSLLEASRVGSPPCALSLTLMRGRAVAYAEPLITGIVRQKHIDYLARLAGRLGAG